MRLRIFLVSLVVFVVFIAVTTGGGFLWLRSRGLPLRQGEVRLTGGEGGAAVSAPVTVVWDRWGVPHVSAASGTDVAAAQGWLHANDRLFQMELGRRAAAGRLSEVFGEVTLAADRHFRTLRFRATAEKMWDWAGVESRAFLTAYAAGVNAWIEQRHGDLPPSFRILDLEPEPWTPVDSLGFVLMMADDLSFWSGRPEEERFAWLRAFGAERTRELVGDPGLWIAPEIEALAAAGLPPGDTAARVPGRGVRPEVALGSNNWALGASRTASGAPLVANDPHLGLRLPGVWYQVLLRSPDYEVAGMSLPGVPGVVIGRNRDLAWALTNVMLDDHDLFFEPPESQGAEEVRREIATIGVRGGEEVTLELLSTDRGPLLPADPGRGLPARRLAWTLYHEADPLGAFLALGRASRVEEVPEAIGGYAGPAQNLVVADRQGGLLYTALGRVPERTLGDGRMPSPGWLPEYGWAGLRPRESNPTLLAPEDDLLVTANADHLPPDYPLPLAADFDGPHRAERIRQLLAGRGGWRAEEMAEVQSDVVSLYARRVVAALGGESFEGEAAEAAAHLAGWDGTMRGSEAALFALVERELRRGVFGDEAAEHGLASFDSRERLLRVLEGEMDPAWFDDVSTPEVEGRAVTLGKALAAAWRRASESQGSDPGAWRWEELHRLRLTHPLGQVPLLGRWFDRGPYPLPGSSTTVNALGDSWRGDEARILHGPSMRWVADLADPDRGLAVLPGGQSGHPRDPHYDDQIPLYVEGGLRPVAWSEEAIEAAAVSRLTLLP